MLEIIAALKDMSKEDLLREYEKYVTYNAKNLEAALGKSGKYQV